MAARNENRYPRRALLAMLALFVVLGGILAGAHVWSNAELVPKLGLDLEGGTQIILEPRLVGGATVSPDQIAQARDIIVQRVDAGGVAGAEVTTQGGRNIVVSMPGVPDQATEDAIRRSSQLQFRPVLAIGPGSPQPALSPSPGPSGSPSPEPSGAGTGDSSPATSPSANPAPASPASPATPTSPTAPSPGPTNNSAVPEALTADPTDPTSLEWITPEVQQEFDALDCTADGALDGIVDDPAKPLVTCDADDSAKYILAPVVVSGDQIADAAAGYQVLQNGQPGSTVEISLTLKDEGAKKYADISREMVALPEPQNQLAATLDSQVIVAPRFNEAILDGRASITGGFTLEEARGLAQQLKFGALPISFDLQTREQISPTLGSEQLRYGLVAGLVGLLLVAGYSLLQYRALGFVTIASIVVAAALTYLVIVIFGWSRNYRLDMAGVTGLIVAIGFTADSFIVYFERVRDELREGRALGSAVEAGWNRAKRTILAADSVNFLAALVLYLLASQNVRGFAFTLGLTTLIDLLVVFWFTHPLLAVLARRPFFRDGHRFSGLDPSRLGAKPVRYAGRGRFTGARPAAPVAEGSIP